LDAVDAAARFGDLGELRSCRVQREILSLDEDERLEDLALELLAALYDAGHQDFLLNLGCAETRSRLVVSLVAAKPLLARIRTSFSRR
jgi:hypothetical protein